MLTESKAPAARAVVAARSREMLAQRYERVRRFTRRLVEPLSPEDCVVQSMPDASPAKWHLAHTTWFFEALAIEPFAEQYHRFDERFNYLFNSYYIALGERHSRSKRGLLTRPSLDEVSAFRDHVDRAMRSVIEDCRPDQWNELAPVVEIGISHEQQHQELLLTDLKHLLSCNPSLPTYRDRTPPEPHPDAPGMKWAAFDGGVCEIGDDGAGFAYDNERPRHRIFLEPFEISTRLVTSGEYLRFIEDGGYERPELWLDEGWAKVNAEGWTAPLYWRRNGGEWKQFTLSGERDIEPCEPVCHISFFEAEAYARWAGARLPTEHEWETATGHHPIEGNFVESGAHHPVAAPEEGDPSSIRQLFGDVWEWTRSQYDPYPGYHPPAGAIGEYNGKFMCNQFVLRGGSCVTSQSHMRRTYRNYFPPASRWQFSGLRLARSLR